MFNSKENVPGASSLGKDKHDQAGSTSLVGQGNYLPHSHLHAPVLRRAEDDTNQQEKSNARCLAAGEHLCKFIITTAALRGGVRAVVPGTCCHRGRGPTDAIYQSIQGYWGGENVT